MSSPPHHRGAGALCADHLRELRPIKVSRPGRQERFVVPEIRELNGTPFALSPDEERFVTTMVDGRRRMGLRKHNVAIFRSDQTSYCGDFVCVDVSSPPRSRGGLPVPSWEVFVIDLKMGAPLTVGGGGAGIQLKNAPRAAEVAHRLLAERQVGPRLAGSRRWQGHLAPREVWLIVGDRRRVEAFFRHLRHVRRHHRRVGDKQAVVPMLERRIEARQARLRP